MNQDEIYPCSGGCTSLSVKEVMELMKLKQNIEYEIGSLNLALVTFDDDTEAHQRMKFLKDNFERLLKGDTQ